MNKAVFLDRDGTLNEDVDYLTRVEDIKIISKAKKALENFKNSGFLNIIITNQSAIARGYLTEKKLSKIHLEFHNHFTLKNKNLIDGIYYSPFHKDGIIKEYKSDSFYRKPSIGLVLKAAIIHNIDLSKSFFIGDSFSDMECAKNAGIKKILVLTGYGTKTLKDCKKLKIDYVVDNIFEASKLLKSI